MKSSTQASTKWPLAAAVLALLIVTAVSAAQNISAGLSSQVPSVGTLPPVVGSAAGSQVARRLLFASTNSTQPATTPLSSDFQAAQRLVGRSHSPMT